jgi:hypothetical protein
MTYDQIRLRTHEHTRGHAVGLVRVGSSTSATGAAALGCRLAGKRVADACGAL